jgi:UDP-N-acetylglucosamine:LPS N-acetylglucosamine transferase
MAWYPTWVVALDQVAKGTAGAVVDQQDAKDTIREIKKMTAELHRLRKLEDAVRKYEHSRDPDDYADMTAALGGES